jgi:CMP-N-acetylneuraminic acid synthetase
MKIMGIVPARGGSKGLPHKNIYPLLGKPLIAYTIEAGRKSRMIDRLILSSDSEEIIRIGRKYGIEAPFVRPSALARDDTPSLPVVRHTVSWLKENEGYIPDIIVLLQVTSPMRTAEHIDKAVQMLIDSDADSIVSVVKVPHNFNPYSVMRMVGDYVKPFLSYKETENLRQKKPAFYARNGAAIYAFRYDCLMIKNSLYGDSTLAFLMDKQESVDIDDLFDVKLCEFLLSRRGELY